MSFHRPVISERALACSTSSSRPVGEVPSSAASTSRLSGASSRARAWPASAANDARKSTWQTSASETPGFTRPGQRTINGTRVPPSNALYLPPRNGPAGRWPPSFSTAWSR